ncbi:MAG: hypothetical protein RLZZ450_1295 [Pseudomonadota bacterium]|jgi:hypothetical protein
MAEKQSDFQWRCFPEVGPPEGVIAGWRMLLGLPRGAQVNLWLLIRVGLIEPETSEQRQLVEGYAMRFEANPAHLVGAVRACQHLLRDAAARKLEEHDLMADLRAISSGNPAGLELLAAHFTEVRNALRLRLLEDTLADYGNVLVGFDWRLDAVSSSNHGELDDAPIVFLNLAYRHGEETRKLPLQLTPSAIASLKAFFERFQTV